MTNDQRLKLKKLYESIANEAEKKDLAKFDALQVKQLIDGFQKEIEQSDENYQKLIDSFTKYANASHKHSQSLIDQFSSFTDSLSKNIDQLGGKITSSERNKTKDFSGFFKDFGTQLAEMSGHSKRTADLITNLKWNTSMGVRNSSGSPINPSVDLFNIGTVDDIVLAYTGSNITSITYNFQGVLKAVLTLSYSGSNLTEVKRTT